MWCFLWQRCDHKNVFPFQCSAKATGWHRYGRGRQRETPQPRVWLASSNHVLNTATKKKGGGKLFSKRMAASFWNRITKMKIMLSSSESMVDKMLCDRGAFIVLAATFYWSQPQLNKRNQLKESILINVNGTLISRLIASILVQTLRHHYFASPYLRFY